MALADDINTAAASLRAVLDAVGFLDPGAKTGPDAELIAEIEADAETLEGDGVTLATTWRGYEHAPTAEEMADWLFDGYPPGEHRLIVTARADGTDESLSLTVDVPFPWR